MTEPEAAARPTSRAISSYARTARRAIRLQLGVAGLALIATIIFAFILTTQTAKLNAVNDQLKAASSRLESADNATQAVLQAASALASGDDARYGAAIQSLETARERLGIDFINLDEDATETALAELRLAHHNVSRTLASLLSSRPGRSPENLARAIALETENLAQPALTGPERYASTIALAAYHCAADDSAGAKNLLDEKFLTANPEATRDSVLLDACDSLFSLPQATITTFDPTTAEAEYRIRRIFLHIVTEADRGSAQALGRALCIEGYSVPRIEVVSKSAAPKDNQVRYYYPPQASEADWIASRFAAQTNAGWTWAPPAIRQLTGFDNLDPQNIEIWLQESPPAAGAPIAPSAVDNKFSCTPSSRVASQGVAGLVTQVTSDDKASRVSAGQLIADRLRSDSDGEMVAALIAQLQSPRLEQLSATARLNVLYMLNVESSWQSRPEANTLRETLAAIRARSGKGIAIGGQTNDCLTNLEAKLRGEAAPDSCGGL